MMDLNLVRLLRSAMNGGRIGPLGPASDYNGGQPIHRFVDADADRNASRLNINLASRSEPIREPRELAGEFTSINPAVIPACDRSFETSALPSPIIPTKSQSLSDIFPPPWKQLPIDTPPAVIHKIKVIKVEVDIINKGSLLDFFC